MQIRQNKKTIGLDALLLAVYFAITPIHQAILLPNGSTVTKYLAFMVMIVVLLIAFVFKKDFKFDNRLLNSLAAIVAWFALGLIYSEARETTLSGIISIVSYFALMIIVCSKEWTDYEKHLFKLALILACVFYSVTLIEAVATSKRATFISGSTGLEADQNILAINIGIGYMFALSYFSDAKRVVIKILTLSIALLIIAGVICTGSRGALIAIIGTTLYYLFSYTHTSRRLKVWTIVFAVIIFSATMILLNTDILGNEFVTSRYSSDYEGDFFSGRLEVWAKYFDVLLQMPYGFIIGYGYNGVSTAYGGYLPATHNDIIHIICCGGIVAVILFCRFIRLVWNKASLNKDILGKALMILVIIGGLSVDSFQRYGWWNAMIFAYIGIGVLSSNGKSKNVQ